MTRGKQKLKQLSATIQPEQVTLFPPPEETNLYDEKVKLLCHRYCFYLTNTAKRDEILNKLSKEFFISTGRIADILVEQTDTIKAIRTEAPKKSWFQMQWAHLVW